MTRISPDDGSASKACSPATSSPPASPANAIRAENTPCGRGDFGTHDTRRGRLGPAFRLHPLQSGQAWAGAESGRLAAFVVPSLREARCAAEGLGWTGCERVRLRRARRLIPDCASLHPGYSFIRRRRDAHLVEAARVHRVGL